jgi:hypothetical protein
MTGNSRGIIIQDRDRHLLRELAIMRVVDRDQAKCVAGFGSTTRANTRLLSLTRAGFLRRFLMGTMGGAKKSLYALSPKGAALAEVPYRGPRRASDQTFAADFFVAHQLQINRLYCTLKYRPIPIADVKFVHWMTFHAPLDSGSALIPDGYAEVALPSKTIAMFLEIDLGHESRTVWQKKVRNICDTRSPANSPSGSGRRSFERSSLRTPSAG